MEGGLVFIVLLFWWETAGRVVLYVLLENYFGKKICSTVICTLIVIWRVCYTRRRVLY